MSAPVKVSPYEFEAKAYNQVFQKINNRCEKTLKPKNAIEEH